MLLVYGADLPAGSAIESRCSSVPLCQKMSSFVSPRLSFSLSSGPSWSYAVDSSSCCHLLWLWTTLFLVQLPISFPIRSTTLRLPTCLHLYLELPCDIVTRKNTYIPSPQDFSGSLERALPCTGGSLRTSPSSRARSPLSGLFGRSVPLFQADDFIMSPS